MNLPAALALLVGVILLFTSPLWIIPLKRGIERSVIRRLEARQFALGGATSTPVPAFDPRRPILFPLATSLTPAYAALGATISIDPGMLVAISFVGGVGVPAVLLGAASYLHHVRGRRRLKYDLIFAAMIQWVAFSGLVAALVSWLIFLVCQVAAFYLVRYLVPSGRAVAAFHLVQSRWFLVTGILVTPVLFFYALLRFYLVEAMAQRPILYFRSFHHPDAPVVFRNIVAKAARRFGIIEGLVHPTQRGSELHGTLDVTDQAHFSYASDAAWRDWVVGKLRSASVVMIDVTDETDSLKWEIAESIKIVGVTRVAVLAARGQSPLLPANAWRLSYTLDRRGIVSARRELAGWLRLQLLPHRHEHALVAQSRRAL